MSRASSQRLQEAQGVPGWRIAYMCPSPTSDRSPSRVVLASTEFTFRISTRIIAPELPPNLPQFSLQLHTSNRGPERQPGRCNARFALEKLHAQ